jgi:hypothetical protein
MMMIFVINEVSGAESVPVIRTSAYPETGFVRSMDKV